jgi:hypothetical protein
MSSASQVPETRLLGEGELSADHAWRTLRRDGSWQLLRDALVRFRSGDGFSHARALGQLAPFASRLGGILIRDWPSLNLGPRSDSLRDPVTPNSPLPRTGTACGRELQ